MEDASLEKVYRYSVINIQRISTLRKKIQQSESLSNYFLGGLLKNRVFLS